MNTEIKQKKATIFNEPQIKQVNKKSAKKVTPPTPKNKKKPQINKKKTKVPKNNQEQKKTRPAQSKKLSTKKQKFIA